MSRIFSRTFWITINTLIILKMVVLLLAYIGTL